MGPFPETPTRNRYILVITEYLTCWCEATTVPDTSADTIAHALLHKLILYHGCPTQLLSDQGKQFAGEVMEVLTTSLGICSLLTSPYHPQTNGLTERMNKTLKQMISAYVDPLHSNWDRILPFVVHAHNTSVQASTRISPFRALYGRDPRLPPDPTSCIINPRTTDASDWWLHLQQNIPLIRTTLLRNLQTAQTRQKKAYDTGRLTMEYADDDLVWVYYPLRRRGLSESLMHRWIGTYRILQRIHSNTYQLQRLSNASTTTAHVIRLKPYHSPQNPQPHLDVSHQTPISSTRHMHVHPQASTTLSSSHPEPTGPFQTPHSRLRGEVWSGDYSPTRKLPTNPNNLVNSNSH